MNTRPVAVVLGWWDSVVHTSPGRGPQVKRVLTFLPALLLVFGFVAAPVYADQTISHDDAGIEFDIPDDWETEELDEDTILIGPPDETFVVFMWVERADDWADLADALEALDDELGEILEDVRHDDDDAAELDLNGLPAIYVTGTGSIEGEAVEWAVAIVLADEPVILLAFADPETFDGVAEKEFKEFVETVRPD
jgi:hypothetical protein